MLCCRGKKSDKLMRSRPQIADASVSRQGRHVKQNSGGTLKLHVSIIAV